MIYPYIILAIVLVCTALILSHLWVNMSGSSFPCSNQGPTLTPTLWWRTPQVTSTRLTAWTPIPARPALGWALIQSTPVSPQCHSALEPEDGDRLRSYPPEQTVPSTQAFAPRLPADRRRRGHCRLVGKAVLENSGGGQRLSSQTRLLMGTHRQPDFDRPATGKPPRQPSRPFDACLSRMAELEAVLSRFQARQPGLDPEPHRQPVQNPHPALLDLVRQSRSRSAQLSNGLFDITILPVLALYQGYQAPGQGLPPAAAIETACRKVDYRCLDRESRSGLHRARDGHHPGWDRQRLYRRCRASAGWSSMASPMSWSKPAVTWLPAGGGLESPLEDRHSVSRPAGERLVTRLHAPMKPSPPPATTCSRSPPTSPSTIS